MYNHEPKDYQCSFCLFVQGHETEYNRKSDIVYEDEQAIAFISPKWWDKNPGNVIIIPKKHFENIYDIPDSLLAYVAILGKKLAIAIKIAYHCDGTSLRQHNEPAGEQDMWHYHLHVFPRYINDNLYQNHDHKRFVAAEERLPFAEKLRKYFKEHHE